MTRLRLGVLSTHPVQYQAPLYRALAARPDVKLKVFYAHLPTPQQQGQGFGVPFSWDVDLLAGYESVLLENRAAAKGTGFNGYDTPAIRRYVQRGRFDAFLVTGWHARTLVQGIAACLMSGTPLLVRGDSYLRPSESPVKRAIKRALYPLFLQRVDACLAVGIRSEEYFAYYGAKRIFRVPHFADNDFFARSGRTGRTRDQIRAAWGIPRDAFVCVFVGKLMSEKRPIDLVRAAAESKVHLLVAGDGALRAECEAEATRLGVNATFLGFVNQGGLPDVYASADVLALPSESETWGMVVNEAMASGLPVVVAETVGSAPDLVADGVTGFIHRVGDVKSLADALDEIRRSLSIGQPMGEAARRRVSAYTAVNAAEALVDAARAVARTTVPAAPAPIVLRVRRD